MEQEAALSREILDKSWEERSSPIPGVKRRKTTRQYIIYVWTPRATTEREDKQAPGVCQSFDGWKMPRSADENPRARGLKSGSSLRGC